MLGCTLSNRWISWRIARELLRYGCIWLRGFILSVWVSPYPNYRNRTVIKSNISMPWSILPPFLSKWPGWFSAHVPTREPINMRVRSLTTSGLHSTTWDLFTSRENNPPDTNFNKLLLSHPGYFTDIFHKVWHERDNENHRTLFAHVISCQERS